MIGIVIVRQGRAGSGVNEVARVVDDLWLLGDGLDDLEWWPENTSRRVELGAYAPAAWTQWIVEQIDDRSVVLAASPDGRDLAGRLGERLSRRVFTGCLDVRVDSVVEPRFGGATTVVSEVRGPFIATVQTRSSAPGTSRHEVGREDVELRDQGDVEFVELVEPDLESVDLADARRIVAGGAGLADEADFDVLAEAAGALGAAMGATRVITDRGWLPFRRQIGTTGATVSPELYVAFGISGAVQHTSGLGSPDHVISVNTDASCPMSTMADLAIVADASATLGALVGLMGEQS